MAAPPNPGWDVVVVGGGNAALCAALSAAEAGARVLMLESAPEPWRGGNSVHTRNIRCMHEAPEDVLTGAYTEEEFWQDLLQVTAGKTNEALARQVVRSELAVRPALVAQVAREAVNTVLMSARHITVQVHPDDHALVALGCEEALAARGARLLAQPTVARGGCRVESDAGVIDALVATRWAQATQAMGSGVPLDDADAAGDTAGGDA